MTMKMNNDVYLRGHVFSHDLQIKKDNSGNTVASGVVTLLVNEKESKTLPVRVYIREKTKAGGVNKSFEMLKRISGSKGYEEVGKDALRVYVAARLGMNEYFSDKSGAKKLNSFPQVQTVFTGLWSEDLKGPEQAEFVIDGIIEAMDDEIDANEEFTGTKIIKLKYVDDFRKVPSTFTMRVLNEDGISFFNTRVIPKQTIMQVRGTFVDTVVGRPVTSETEVAFGSVAVMTTSAKTRSDLVITGGNEPYSTWFEEEEMAEIDANRKKEVQRLSDQFDEKNGGKQPTQQKFGAKQPEPAKSVAQQVAEIIEDNDFEF